MRPEVLQCPDDPENTQYDDSILLASPAYPLKVDSDVCLTWKIVKKPISFDLFLF